MPRQSAQVSGRPFSPLGPRVAGNSGLRQTSNLETSPSTPGKEHKERPKGFQPEPKRQKDEMAREREPAREGNLPLKLRKKTLCCCFFPFSRYDLYIIQGLCIFVSSRLVSEFAYSCQGVTDGPFYISTTLKRVLLAVPASLPFSILFFFFFPNLVDPLT